MALNDSKIRAAKPLAKSYKITDAQGLYLMVTPAGSRLWYFRYRFDGKESRLALGTYPQVTLAEAREKREAARKLLASGLNPTQQRPPQKIVTDETQTFKYLAKSWHTASLKLWSENHAAKILTCLERYAFPLVGQMDIADIETLHLAQLLKNIDDSGVHDVAGRMRQYLNRIMRHGVQQGIINTIRRLIWMVS